MLRWLEGSHVALWVSDLSGWPLALTLHSFGAALIIGFALILGLRLLGLFNPIPLRSLSKLILLIWVALWLQVFSGILLWLTKPARYFAMDGFNLKLSLVVIGCLSMVYVQRVVNGRNVPLSSYLFSGHWLLRLGLIIAGLTWIIGVSVTVLIPWGCPYGSPCGYYPSPFWTIVTSVIVLCGVAALARHLDKQSNWQTEV